MMSEERENPIDPRTDRAPPATTAPDSATDSSDINPYQAPAYHPEERPEQPAAGETPGEMFWIAAAVTMVLAIAVAILTSGAGLPLPFAVMLGTMRASALFARQSQKSFNRIPAVVLLITSTLLTLLLMFCCAIAFVTICTTGSLAAREIGAVVWMMISAAVALGAFIFLFIQSLRWSV